MVNETIGHYKGCNDATPCFRHISEYKNCKGLCAMNSSWLTVSINKDRRNRFASQLDVWRRQSENTIYPPTWAQRGSGQRPPSSLPLLQPLQRPHQDVVARLLLHVVHAVLSRSRRGLYQNVPAVPVFVTCWNKNALDTIVERRRNCDIGYMFW